MNQRNLAHQIQSARRKAHLTQQQLCEKAHLSYSTLAKIERGAIKEPSVFTVNTIAQNVGITLDELLAIGVKI